MLPSDALDTRCEKGMRSPMGKCFARGKLFFTSEALVLLLRRAFFFSCSLSRDYVPWLFILRNVSIFLMKPGEQIQDAGGFEEAGFDCTCKY